VLQASDESLEKRHSDIAKSDPSLVKYIADIALIKYLSSMANSLE
jgi:hypothetical protein